MRIFLTVSNTDFWADDENFRSYVSQAAISTSGSCSKNICNFSAQYVLFDNVYMCLQWCMRPNIEKKYILLGLTDW